MKLILIILCCTLWFGNLSAQTSKTPRETFIIVAQTVKSDTAKIIKSVFEADFDLYRLRSVHRKITFDTGVVVELLSAVELKAMGYEIDLMSYTEFLPNNYIEPIYTITPEGYLLQVHKSLPTK